MQMQLVESLGPPWSVLNGPSLRMLATSRAALKRGTCSSSAPSPALSATS